MSNLEERLVNCFATVFPELGRDEIRRASTASVASWDSLATVTLVSVVEEEFNVSLTPEEYEYVVSFEMVRECLAGKGVDG